MSLFPGTNSRVDHKANAKRAEFQYLVGTFISYAMDGERTKLVDELGSLRETLENDPAMTTYENRLYLVDTMNEVREKLQAKYVTCG